MAERNEAESLRREGRRWADAAEARKRRFPAWAALALGMAVGVLLGVYLSGLLAGGEVRATVYTLAPQEREGKSGLAVTPAAIYAGSRVPLVVKNLSSYATPVTVTRVYASGREELVWRSERPLEPGEAVRLEGFVARKGVKAVRVSTGALEGGQKLSFKAIFEVKVI
ncbi:MAG: hypothetical protein ACPLRW_13015 [Moorellales bacterium]